VVRVAFLAILLAITGACMRPATTPSKGIPAGESSLWVYVSPPRGDAARLRFQFAEISAVRVDGSTVPMRGSLQVFDRDELSHERLAASGSLDPGPYIGLEVTVADATLDRGAAEAELRIPDGPTRIEYPFTVGRRRAVVLSLELDYEDAVDDAYRFVPNFRVTIPKEPAVGLFAMATSRGTNTLTLYEKISGRAFGVVPVGRAPAAIALGRQNAFVTLTGENAVAIVGPLEQVVLERIPLSAGDRPEGLALTPDGLLLLTANSGSATVSVIDVPTRTEVDRILVGEGPRSLNIDPAGRRAWVLNTTANTISVIDLVQRRVVTTLATDPEPLLGAFDRRGDRFYVIHPSSPNMTVIDAPALTVLSRVYVGPRATALAVEPRSDRVLLSRAGTGVIDVYDPSSLLSVDFLRVGGDVAFLAVDDEGYNLHAVFAREPRIRVLRLSNGRVMTDVDVGSGASWVTVAGER
jgi:YVTN family beta-propeller protein